jgi:hypothetical protein
VQRLAHRDPGVLEAGDVDDAAHPVVLHRLEQRTAVQDRAAHEGHAARHEVLVAGGQVIDHDGLEARGIQCPHDVGADVAGAAGHEPRHATKAIGTAVEPARGGSRRGRRCGSRR